MEWLQQLLDYALHLDRHLLEAIQQYGPWVYGILFLIVFCETGLVITPFLPGDTLLFAAGILANSKGDGLNFWLLWVVFIGAALAGDNVNYQLGRLIGKKLFNNEKSKIFKKSNLDQTHAFFEKHGGKTIILARFVPIVRTFAPFVAGMGAMTYMRFLGYSIFAAFLWVAVCMGAGYLFGGIEAVRENFALAVLGLVGFSLIPYAIEFIKWRARKKQNRAASSNPIVEAAPPVGE
ncbi:MAG: DedA family protein [Armatimonadetes bacterium]|nr:DedA family protein [Armatimonadota bacterium]